MGNGVYAAEIYRNFNRFIENTYLDRFTQHQRWEEQSSIMQMVENIFNEANRDGINSQLSSFFNNWSRLSGQPDSEAIREALKAQSDNMALLFRDSYASLQAVQYEMDEFIRQSVDSINRTLDRLKDVTTQIYAQTLPGRSLPNALLDERDRLVREISELINIRVDDKGPKDFNLFTEAGQPLLHELSVFKLILMGPQSEKLTQNFTGDLKFVGNDSYEYTLEFTDHQNFKVSLDGGKTWLRDVNGNISTYPLPNQGETVKVKNLEISFESNPGDTLTAGDRFLITPKTAIYWDSPTREPINITPQVLADGTENQSRITGGKLAAYFSVRDHHVGRYMDKLDALAQSLIWEVNYLHSQGAGLNPLANMEGTYKVGQPNAPLGSLHSQLLYSDRLTAGNVSFYFYDATTGESIGVPLPQTGWTLDFANPPAGDGTVTNFDPTVHSLYDVLDAINRNFPDPNDPSLPPRNLLTATIEDGKLHIQAADGVTFNLGTDSSGLMAALGLNTFFQGTGAQNFSLNPSLDKNLGRINSHSVDGQTEANAGDGYIAAKISALATKSVPISTIWEHSNQTLIGYHASLVGLIGSETQTAIFNEQYNRALAQEMDARVSAISGVNLDEEMTNLIRFQHAYTAAAKLITTADQMMETILGLKQ